jgi:hypothetical protein
LTPIGGGPCISCPLFTIPPRAIYQIAIRYQSPKKQDGDWDETFREPAAKWRNDYVLPSESMIKFAMAGAGAVMTPLSSAIIGGV